VLAGGTDLIVQLRGKRFAPDRVIDIKNVPEANELSYGPRRGLVIGAGVPCWRFYNDAEIAELNSIINDIYSEFLEDLTKARAASDTDEVQDLLSQIETNCGPDFRARAEKEGS